VRRGSIDSTGFESRHVSQHFLHRRNQSGKPLFTRFHPKLTVLCDCRSHLIVSIKASRGPNPDSADLIPVVKNLVPGMKIDLLLADAGYDSEKNHCFLNANYGIKALIPATIGRPTLKQPSGFFRRKMKAYFKRFGSVTYGQRWQVETVFSMIKRNFGSALSARSLHARYRELYLKALCHNIALELK